MTAQDTAARSPILGAFGNWRPGYSRLVSGAILAIGAIVAYSGTFSVPLLFDDRPAIVDNPTIRHWSTAFWAPQDTGAAGRPMVNLSLAVNYAISGESVWSYHALNLGIHILSGLLLFGIVRRTLALRAYPASSLVGFATAFLWTLHPLQTESVTFIIQRTESLLGRFYLLTLYCFIRGSAADRGVQRRWFVVSVASCFLGMATKEVMVSAPLIVLLYDRTFVAGSFRSAWQRRRVLYVGLGCAWLLLAALMIGSQQRGGTVGFGLGVTPWEYLLTQCRAIVIYLKLCFWPYPLVVDYGTTVVRNPLEVLPQAVVVVALAAGTILALWRRPALGFLGAWFFAILAPSSSVVPLVTQTIAEHRMYLPLAAVVTLVAIGIHAAAKGHSWAVYGVLALGLGILTVRRNDDYRSAWSIWSDTVAKRPDNERAHNNLGNVLAETPGRLNEAIAQFQAALKLRPDYALAHNNLGKAWAKVPGRLEEAMAQYREALQLRPDFAEAHNNLGNALAELPGRLNEAIAEFQEAVRLQPDFAEAYNNLGNAWAKVPGRLGDAIGQYQEALRLKPDFAEAHNNLGNAWVQIPGRLNDAIAEYQEAVRLKPAFAEAHNNLGNAWADEPGRLNDAITQYEEAVRLKPDYAEAHYNLGNAWAQISGRQNDALAEFQETVRLRPNFEPGWYNLGVCWANSGNLESAAGAFREALRVSPNDAAAQEALTAVLQQARTH